MVKIVKPHTCKAKGAMEAKLAALQGHEVTVNIAHRLLRQLTGRRYLFMPRVTQLNPSASFFFFFFFREEFSGCFLAYRGPTQVASSFNTDILHVCGLCVDLDIVPETLPHSHTSCPQKRSEGKEKRRSSSGGGEGPGSFLPERK